MKLLTIIALIFQLYTGAGSAADCTLYPLHTTVTTVNYSTDTVQCVDFNGNQWEFTGAGDWIQGDYCEMIMCNNGTKNIYDDFIVTTRYDGYEK